MGQGIRTDINKIGTDERMYCVYTICPFKAFEIFNNYLYEKTSEDIVVSNSKELEVSFYDYKNESYAFQYNQYEGKIRLINTRKSIAPSHNITVIIWNEDQLEEQIKYAIEYLI